MIWPATANRDRGADMAIDVVSACATADASSTPQGYFVGLSVLFSLYIGVDMLIAAMVVRRKMSEHASTT